MVTNKNVRWPVYFGPPCMTLKNTVTLKSRLGSRSLRIMHDRHTACSENVGKMKDEMCGRVAKLETEMASKHLEFKNLNQVVEQIDDAFKKLVNERLENVVEKHTISFTDIVKQQLEEEMVKNVGETVKKEVHE